MSLPGPPGFYDGEGCTHSFTARARVFMAMTQGGGDEGRLVLHRFQAAVGGLGRYYVTPAKRTHGIIHRWQCAVQADVHHALNRIWPWLGKVKREQALQAIAVRAAWERGEGPPESYHRSAWRPPSSP
jgi:hypothetical protein